MNKRKANVPRKLKFEEEGLPKEKNSDEPKEKLPRIRDDEKDDEDIVIMEDTQRAELDRNITSIGDGKKEKVKFISIGYN